MTDPLRDNLGPRPMVLSTLLLRALGGLGGGLLGTGLFVVIAFLGAGILGSAFGANTDGGTIHPLFVFVFLAMIFLGSCAANVLGPLFAGLADREKYTHLSSSLAQIFIANVVILVVVAPVYMIVSTFNPEFLTGVAALQILVSAFASALILEIVAQYRYALLGVYSTAFAVLASSGVYFLFYGFSSGNPLILLFIALPVIWLSITLFGGVLEWVYGLVYKLYGMDFLSSVMKYGRDVRWTTEAEDEATEEQHDVELTGRKEGGADFLKRNN